jgi:exosome complex component RRP41
MDNVKLVDKKGLRTDGRKINELRSIKLEVGILENADGSAYIEQGKNKILAAVYGPSEVHPRHLAKSDRGILRCRYHMAPFSVQERKSPAPSRREVELSMVIRKAIEPALFLEKYPKTSIDLYIEVLQADGGTRCAGINVASLALADAGIPMKDIVVACAAGKVDEHIVLDLNDIEDKEGKADVPIAYLPSFNNVSLLQMDGLLNLQEFKQVLELAVEGCKQISVIQKESLKAKYLATIKDITEVEEK